NPSGPRTADRRGDGCHRGCAARLGCRLRRARALVLGEVLMVGADSSGPRADGNALEQEVMLNGLRSIAHEMAVTVANCAISQVVRDSLDFSTAVFDGEGRTVAQGLSIPLHLGAMPSALEHVRAQFDRPEPGSVF